MCVCVCVCARKPLQILLESIPDVEVEPCLFGLAILWTNKDVFHLEPSGRLYVYSLVILYNTTMMFFTSNKERSV